MNSIDIAKRLLAEAESVAILTGAGVSTDSGIPDYRGPNGLWTLNPELEAMANIDGFMNDPDVRKYFWLRKVVPVPADISPNIGHYLLADYQNNSGKVSKLVTQNVDGLHLEAGSDPGTTIEIHGSMSRAKCTGCGLLHKFPTFTDDYVDPTCPSCFSLLKPDIVMFGESLNMNLYNAAISAAREADVLLCVGTSLSVYPIADMATFCNGRVVTISNTPTDMEYLALSLLGEINDILPDLLEF